MRFDTKIVVVLRDDLPAWQKLNVTAFVVSGIGVTAPEAVGEAYQDASGRTYLPMFVQPVLVFAATAGQLRDVCARVPIEGTQLAIYTEDLFRTGNDVDNRAAVRAVRSDDLRLVGLAMRGEKKLLDRLLQGLALHP
jgi:hypothetical protein